MNSKRLLYHIVGFTLCMLFAFGVFIPVLINFVSWANDIQFTLGRPSRMTIILISETRQEH